MTRFTKKNGFATKQVCTEIHTNDHKALQKYAASENKSVQQLLREHLKPLLDSIRPKKEPGSAA